jgi:hypothetical protein
MLIFAIRHNQVPSSSIALKGAAIVIGEGHHTCAEAFMVEKRRIVQLNDTAPV